jgi:hypothetical protein
MYDRDSNKTFERFVSNYNSRLFRFSKKDDLKKNLYLMQFINFFLCDDGSKIF